MALKKSPAQRTARLTVQSTPESTLVFDSANGRTLSLNPVLAAIWACCDGRHSLDAMADAATHELHAEVTPEIVLYALAELRRENLLAPPPLPPRPRPVSRRDLVLHLDGAAATLMPMLTSIVPPTSLHSFGCVLSDTPVQLAGGSCLPASQIVAGQWLAGFDPDARKLRPARVKAVHQLGSLHAVTLFTRSGDVLQASPSHLLLAGMEDRDGTCVSALQPGDPLLAYCPTQQRIVATTLAAVQYDPHPHRVISLEMDTPEHTFLTGGLVSHNNIHPSL